MNPAADEVIQTGEIETQAIPARSMIVRSSSSIPKIEIHDPDEATLLMHQPTPARPPASTPTFSGLVVPRRHSPLVWVALVVVPVATAGIAFLVMNSREPTAPSVPRPPAATAAAVSVPDDPAPVALQTVGELIGTTIDGATKAASMRAESLAMAPTLRAGIMTDAATFQNQAKDGDTTYNLKSDETVEVFHVAHGQRQLWLRLPSPRAAAVAAPASGKTGLAARDGRLYVVASSQIQDQSGAVSGELLLATPVDFDSVKKRLAEHAARAALVGAGAPVVLVAGPNGKTVTLPIETEANAQLVLDVVVR